MHQVTSARQSCPTSSAPSLAVHPPGRNTGPPRPPRSVPHFAKRQDAAHAYPGFAGASTRPESLPLRTSRPIAASSVAGVPSHAGGAEVERRPRRRPSTAGSTNSGHVFVAEPVSAYVPKRVASCRATDANRMTGLVAEWERGRRPRRGYGKGSAPAFVNCDCEVLIPMDRGARAGLPRRLLQLGSGRRACAGPLIRGGRPSFRTAPSARRSARCAGPRPVARAPRARGR
jgi:hypothetical protein